MAGFDPVGSAPVGSILSTTSGTIVTPLVGTVVIAGTVPALGGIDPVRVSYLAREVLFGGPGEVRVSSAVREVLFTEANAEVRVAYVVREVLMSGNSIAAGGGSVSILW